MTFFPGCLDHFISRYVDAAGFVASCRCGWRVTRKSREAREQAVRAHESERTLVVRRADPGRTTP